MPVLVEFELQDMISKVQGQRNGAQMSCNVFVTRENLKGARARLCECLALLGDAALVGPCQNQSEMESRTTNDCSDMLIIIRVTPN